jgi:hypothetical protein
MVSAPARFFRYVSVDLAPIGIWVLIHQYTDHDDDSASIELLNARATFRADRRGGGYVPEDMEKEWKIYVSELRKGMSRFPKENPGSPLGQAYSRFWNAYREHRKHDRR